MALSYVTVSGNLGYLNGGVLPSATISFTPSPTRVIDSAANEILLSYAKTVNVASDGSFTVNLVATDNADLNPNDWTYLVTVSVITVPTPVLQFNASLPSSQPSVNFSALAPVASSNGTTTIVGPGVVPGGTTGQVLAKASNTDYDTEWVAQSGGGGGGAVDSVNGETGVVVLTASDVGADPAGSAAAVQAASQRTVTLRVAASDAPSVAKLFADYVCDGTADEVEINAASAALSSTYGGSISLSSGGFVIRTSVKIDSNNTHLVGSGWRSTTTISPQATFTPTVVVIFGSTANTSNCSIENLHITGNGKTGATVHGLEAASNLMRVLRVYVDNVSGDGVRLVSRTGGIEFASQLIEDVQTSVGGKGVYLGPELYDTRIVNVTCAGAYDSTLGGSGVGTYGFYIDGQYPHLVNCRAYDNQNHGVYLRGNGTGVVGAQILGGAFDENKLCGIYADTSTKVVITGVSTHSNYVSEISINDAAGASIVANLLDGTNNSGPTINVEGATRAVIADNYIVDPAGGYGLTIADSAYIDVHDNIVTSPNTTPTKSIRVYNTTHSSIHHNTVDDGISEESGSDYNSFDRNNLVGGTVAIVGSHTSVVPMLAGPPEAASIAELWNWLSMSGDPTRDWGSNVGSIAAGNPWGTKIPSVASPITSIVMNVASAGSGLSNCFAALYDSAGNRLGVTADQSAVWNSTGLKTMAISGGPIVPPPGPLYVFWMTTGTAPNFSGSNQASQNIGLAAAAGRSIVSAPTAQSTMPSVLVYSSGALQTFMAWVAVK